MAGSTVDNSAPSPNAQPAVGDAPVEAPVEVVEVEICPNCEAERTDKSVMWCRKCGYHPTLNCVIDLVGEDLERDAAEAPPAEEAAAKPSAAKGLALLARSVPVWVWWSGAAALAAMALGVAARFGTQPESLARLVAALAILFVGGVSTIAAHVWAYFYAVPESDRLSVADMFLRPFYVWSPTIRDVESPGIWRRPTLMAFGVVLELVGLTVVGGIPWQRIWELGPAEPAKRQLVDAIENIGKEDESNGADGASNAAGPTKVRADCVIIGYVPSVASQFLGGSDDEIDFASLVLAADVRGKLRFVGVVSGGIPDEERAAIRKRLKELRRAGPIIPCSVNATWLDPALACRVAYTRLTADSRFESVEYVKLLAELQ